jgi:hypothetical protein
MRKSRDCRRFAVALLWAVGLSLLVASCGDGAADQASSQGVSQVQQPTSVSTGASFPLAPNTVDGEKLSTFRSKDPFIQQAVEVVTTTTTSGASPGTTGTSPTTTYRPGNTTTTRYYGTTTTRYYSTTTTGQSGSTTTTVPPPTTTTTAPHRHTLKILSVADVGGAAAVTFQVDSSVYKDRRVGDVVSSSWGQIKVLDLSSSSRVATLLHGSETLVLSVGQVIYE